MRFYTDRFIKNAFVVHWLKLVFCGEIEILSANILMLFTTTCRVYKLHNNTAEYIIISTVT